MNCQPITGSNLPEMHPLIPITLYATIQEDTQQNLAQYSDPVTN